MYGSENSWFKHYVNNTENIDGDTSDADRNFAEICENAGYAFEQHRVVTEDGYILTVYRIPGKLGEQTRPKPAILFQHGVFDSAYGWVMNY